MSTKEAFEGFMDFPGTSPSLADECWGIWIHNHMPRKVQDEITYPFQNFNESLGMDK